MQEVASSLPAEPAEAGFAGTIVALGASAGGLDALDRFFSALKSPTGAAFVVIQHLAPEHKTMMDTLLARHTAMPVQVATDKLALQAGHVYVIPPGTTMTVSSGRLHLLPRPATGLTLPIDAFFESLAIEAASRAIGIVLSGTGSDGSRGAQALDEAGAWVLAQDPDSARFDGMPRSVIASGAVDHVLAPDGLAAEVTSIIANGEIRPAHPPGAPHLREDLALEPVLRLLGSVMRIDFSQYKPATLLRRVERRLQANNMNSLQAYAEHVTTHRDEIDVLRRELLIPVTRFFRDTDAFTSLSTLALEPLIRRRAEAGREPIRAWVACTATGEEAYSIAMLLLELIATHAPGMTLKMFATDVEPLYLERASAGRYTDAAMAEVPAPLRERWFTRLDGGLWQARPELRQSIVFSRHDLLLDAPFTQVDVVTCRNMLIYLRPPAQDRAIRRLSYALRPGGVLFLGSSESPTAAAGHFTALDARQKIYRLQHRAPPLPPDDLLAARALARGAASRAAARSTADTPRTPAERAAAALIHHYAPASLLVTPERELLHVFGDARRFLSFPSGGATLDVNQLLPAALQPVVATLLHTAVRERSPQRSRAISVKLEGAESSQAESIHLAVWPLDDDSPRVEQLLVCFEPATALRTDLPPVLLDDAISVRSVEQVADLERELAEVRSYLQDSVQDLGTANEELQATNEELMASNEELQSTNEELQSVNEELHTVNAEFQSKITELNDTNTDLESLGRATRIPLVFVDEQLRLTRFTTEATALFRFREADVGRPLTDFNHTFDYPELFSDLRRALEDAAPLQREVLDERGRAWLLTMQPFGGGPLQRSRVVVSCVDVSNLRDMQRLQAVLDALPQHVVVLDRHGGILLVNRPWRDFAERNGARDMLGCGPGASYLDVCRRSAETDPEAQVVLRGLTEVLAGRRPAFMRQYPCHSPTEQRWFLMQAAPLSAGGCIVTHFNITGWSAPPHLQAEVEEGVE
jgi:two-component system CheB/CheR fusion protein